MVASPAPLLPATFVRRDNRFRATVALDDQGGAEVAAHVPNSGRLRELLVPGVRCYVTPAVPLGKCSHVLRLVEHVGRLVSVDARLPPALVAEAWAQSRLGPPFADYTTLIREAALGASRLDILLTRTDRRRLWVETKSVTLVEDGVARFPDAPTQRGRRHLEELARAVAQGDQAAVIFVIGRADARCLEPNRPADPEFAEALAAAQASGVLVLAHTCRVGLNGITLGPVVPAVPFV